MIANLEGGGQETTSKKKSLARSLSLAAGLIIVLISLYGFSQLRSRPGLPPGIDKNRLVQVDQVILKSPDDLEFILGQKRIGEPTAFYLKRDGAVERIDAQTAAAFGPGPFPLVLYFIVGVFCLILGLFVFLLRPEDRRARIFYWASLAFFSILLVSGGYNGLKTGALSYLPGILFYFLYPLAPAFLFHFSLSFSSPQLRMGRVLIYAPALLFSGALTSLFLYSSLKASLEAFRVYTSAFWTFRLFVLGFVALTILYLIIGYRRASLEEEKAKLKWVFFGLFLGLFPFIFLYSLPRTLKITPLLTEEISSAFFVLIPLAFAISILKYRLMDIELVINRGLVYSLLTVLTVSIYLFTVQVFNSLFARYLAGSRTAVSVAGVLLAAAVFHPAQRRIQTFVDRAFFRQSYDYRKCLLRFNERAQKIVSQEQLVDFFLLQLTGALPLEHLGVSICSIKEEESPLLIERGDRTDVNPHAVLSRLSEKPLARRKSAHTLEDIDFSLEKLLEEKKLEMILSLPFKSASLAGFMTLGRKKSGERFSSDDLELLRAMAGELVLNLERIRLQEEVIIERTSREKLDELNRLKTEFISTVSHELRTPMTSIQGLTEILEAGKVKDTAKKEELLHLMASETGRLSRLVHNILDFGKIEQQTREYHLQRTAVQPLVEEVVGLFSPRLKSEGFVLRTKIPKEPLFLNIDPDAVKQALINLVDNALKYSAQEKEVDIALSQTETTVEIQVKDRGIGIAGEDQEKIFEKFFRTQEASRHNPKGVGLGLKIVKHIMDGHGGGIRVASELGKGTTFTLVFPKP